MSTFTERLIELRTSHKLNASEASELIGVGKSAYFNWEHGLNFPTPNSIRKIAEAFEVYPKWLETGEGPKNKSQEEVLNEELRKKKVNENAIIYSVDDAKKLDDVVVCINCLKYMQISKDRKRRIHRVLSDIRTDLESKVLFGDERGE